MAISGQPGVLLCILGVVFWRHLLFYPSQWAQHHFAYKAFLTVIKCVIDSVGYVIAL
jgi:hypothetical protein